MFHVPRFEYDAGPTVLTLTWPYQPFEPVHGSVGGARWSAGGAGASYVVRRDRDLGLTLRVEESELDDVEAMIEWAQGLETFTFYPDFTEDPATSRTVRLAGPLPGTEWSPRRDPEYPHVWLVDLTLRKADGARWTDRFFTEE